MCGEVNVANGDFVSAEQADREDLHKVIVRLKHDLGKYVFFQQAWLSTDADLSAQEDALRADVLCTRSGPQGTSDAMCVWEGFRPYLCGEARIGRILWDIRSDPDVAAIFQAMGGLPEVLDALRTHSTTPEVIIKGRDRCEAVATHVRSLERRIRRLCGVR